MFSFLFLKCISLFCLDIYLFLFMIKDEYLEKEKENLYSFRNSYVR